MIPKIIEGLNDTGYLPFGAKFDDANGNSFVRVIGGFARRRAGDNPENPTGGQWSADELAYPLTITHLPEVSG